MYKLNKPFSIVIQNNKHCFGISYAEQEKRVFEKYHLFPSPAQALKSLE